MIGFESDEAVLHKLRERLRSMTDEELIQFGKQVRKLAENQFQGQLEEAEKMFEIPRYVASF
jgi:septation ring formation regulator EzrA